MKPENVLLADDGRVKVADFGLARAINSETQHTATGGVLIGTVSYLSPELVVNGKADARADVYAAGVLIYEMLTGHKPHQADSPIQVAYKHVHEDIPPPSAIDARHPAVRRRAGRPRHRPRHRAAPGRRARAAPPGTPRPQRPRPRRHQRRRPDGGPDPDHPASAAAARPPASCPRRSSSRRSSPTLDHHGPTTSTTRSATSAVLPPAPPRQRPVVAPAPGRPRPPRRSRRGTGAADRRAGAGRARRHSAAGTSASPATPPPPASSTSAEAAAGAKLDRAGLEMKVADEAYSETVRKGFVISTDPGPGDRVRKDGTVERGHLAGTRAARGARRPRQDPRRRPAGARRGQAGVRRRGRALPREDAPRAG